MSSLGKVDNCSAQRYCTKDEETLSYNGQYVLQWNNEYPPLNSQSIVTVSVYSAYDLTNPVFTQSGVSNTNGVISLSPNAEWFSRYTGSNPINGENQRIYFAVYLQGNDPPPANSMLALQLTATPEEYAEILQQLHPSPSSSTSSIISDSSMLKSESDSHSDSSHSTQLMTTETLTVSSEPPSLSETDEPLDASERSGLSAGAIAGIVVGSFFGLLLLLLLLLIPLYRRRQRQRRMLEKSAAMAKANTSSSLGGRPGGGSDAAVAAVAAGAAVVGDVKPRPDSTSPSDTPLLLGGRPNNSFNSREGSIVDSQLSPRTAVYQPLNLESPRVMMNMPSSTRALGNTAVKSPDPILSTDDARQIGDIFRDALRKPPPVSEDGTSESPEKRESMLMHMDDLEEDSDWRERVASERMQRELEQEASVIRSVAMRAHGSDYSSSRPATSQSDNSPSDN
ncbi:hypothetical protein COEREDRAFT_94922 [Coemansia reversa NRRL 1564]|uniref:Mid2 domain-containing protein n=1 Tax=Coemansia reversa (strain ATCC 12441 / NRRL 1564) TaxID=763665 RepID=A0A2G5B1B5_COERN|nr:hypothetical protein COEREDRAFT_94922 [Coemansia reversa NRRL 1564]|eukprot:PIA12799.1 hypothetical protein COEREDRAFT_94922 [Coemansia reversa NRRL 1564]